MAPHIKTRSVSDIVETLAWKEGMTYYGIAKALGISPTHLLQLRKGTTPLTEVQAMRLCVLLDERAQVLYAEARSSRVKSPEIKEFWAAIASAMK